MNSGIECHWPVVVIIVWVVVRVDVVHHSMCKGRPMLPKAGEELGRGAGHGRRRLGNGLVVLLARQLTRLQRRVGQRDGVVDGLAELLVRVAGCIAAARARGHQLLQELRLLLRVGQIQFVIARAWVVARHCRGAAVVSAAVGVQRHPQTGWQLVDAGGGVVAPAGHGDQLLQQGQTSLLCLQLFCAII